jgi:hypothetical protein
VSKLGQNERGDLLENILTKRAAIQRGIVEKDIKAVIRKILTHNLSKGDIGAAVANKDGVLNLHRRNED